MKRSLLVMSNIILLFASMGMQSCVEVKEYQKVYLNDAEMELSSRKSERTEMNFELYREGTSGANGGKTGGGCGCN